MRKIKVLITIAAMTFAMSQGVSKAEENIEINAQIATQTNAEEEEFLTATQSDGQKDETGNNETGNNETETEEKEVIVIKKNAMYRLYNPNSGEHFYTKSIVEANNLVTEGWTYEGVAWYAPETGDPVYRLYNPNAGDHHYTLSEDERDTLIAAGWNYEGISWYSGGDAVLFRCYNPNAVSGSHHYTLSQAEVDNIVAAGWRYEGTAWRGYTDGSDVEYEIPTSNRTSIMGANSVTLSQMVAYYNAKATYPAYYADTDAPDIATFCQMYLDECATEGVDAAVAFSQAMMETGFLRFGGLVLITDHNFAGLGATDSAENRNIAQFATVREGIRAQVQHLKAYACSDALVNTLIDPRFSLVQRGCAPYVQWLGIQENPYGKGWASAKDYGNNIVNLYMKVMKSY